MPGWPCGIIPGIIAGMGGMPACGDNPGGDSPAGMGGMPGGIAGIPMGSGCAPPPGICCGIPCIHGGIIGATQLLL